MDLFTLPYGKAFSGAILNAYFFHFTMKHSEKSKITIFCVDLGLATTLITVLEILMILFIFMGLLASMYLILTPRLELEKRNVYLKDDYTLNSSYRKLVPANGLENQTDIQSIIATAYVKVFVDVKLVFMCMLALIVSAWAAIMISIIGLWQKRASYLIPRLIWQILGMIGFISSIVVFSLCFCKINKHQQIWNDPNYENEVNAKMIFILFAVFSAVGLVVEILGFIIVFRCVKHFEKLRQEDEVH